MIVATTTPHYARPTAAWKARITPERSRTRYTARPCPKRPPRLLLIRPQDLSRPCYFSRLPSELRLQIYEYILPQDLVLAPASAKYMCGMKQRFIPTLLYVCGRVRLEAAALLYGCTHVTYNLSSFDFRPLEEWLNTLPTEHVEHLAKNRKLTINLRGYFYPPHVKEMTELRESFGNRYLIPRGDSYDQFIKFCLLARWTQWCGHHSIPKKLHWNYRFGLSPAIHGRGGHTFWVLKYLHEWFSSFLWTIAQPTIQNAWIRNVWKRKMKGELVNMLESINKVWWANSARLENPHANSPEISGYSRSEYDSLCQDWTAKVAIVRETINSW